MYEKSAASESTPSSSSRYVPRTAPYRFRAKATSAPSQAFGGYKFRAKNWLKKEPEPLITLEDIWGREALGLEPIGGQKEEAPKKYTLKTTGADIKAIGVGTLAGTAKWMSDLENYLAFAAQDTVDDAIEIPELVSGKFTDPEKQLVYDEYQSKIKDLGKWQIGRRYTEFRDFIQRYNAAERKETVELSADQYSGDGKLTDWIGNVRSSIKEGKNNIEEWQARVQNLQNTSKTGKFFAELSESTPYTAASLLPYGVGFVANYASGTMRGLEEKMAEMQASGKELTSERADAIWLYANGAALIEAGTEQIFTVGALGGQATKVGSKLLAKSLLKQPLKSAALHVGMWVLKNGAEEAFEEVLSGFGQGTLAKLTTDKDKKWFDVADESGALVTLEGLGKQALGGFVMGSVFSTINSSNEYKNFEQSKALYEIVKDTPVEKLTDDIFKKGMDAVIGDLAVKANADAVAEETNRAVLRVAFTQPVQKLIDQEQNKLTQLQKDIPNAKTEGELALLESKVRNTQANIAKLSEDLRFARNAESMWTPDQLDMKVVSLDAIKKQYKKLYDEAPNETMKAQYREELDFVEGQIEKYTSLASGMRQTKAVEDATATPVQKAARSAASRTRTRKPTVPVAQAAPAPAIVAAETQAQPEPVAQPAPVVAAPSQAAIVTPVATAPVVAGKPKPVTVTVKRKVSPAPKQAEAAQKPAEVPAKQSKETTAPKPAKAPAKPQAAPAAQEKPAAIEKPKVAPKQEQKSYKSMTREEREKAVGEIYKKYKVKKGMSINKNSIDSILNAEADIISLEKGKAIRFDKVADRELTSEQSAVVNAIKEYTGVQVVYYRPSEQFPSGNVRGFQSIALKGVIYVSTEAPIMYTAWHELYHLAQDLNLDKPFLVAVTQALAKEGYDIRTDTGLAAALKKLSGRPDEWVARKMQNKAVAHQELFAIRAGQIMGTEAFWKELVDYAKNDERYSGSKGQTLLNKLLDFFNKFLDMVKGIQAEIKETNKEIEAAVNAISNIKDELIQEIAEEKTDAKPTKKISAIKPKATDVGELETKEVKRKVAAYTSEDARIAGEMADFKAAEVEGLADNLGLAFVLEGDSKIAYVNEDGTYSKPELYKLKSRIQSLINRPSTTSEMGDYLAGKRKIVDDIYEKLKENPNYRPAKEPLVKHSEEDWARLIFPSLRQNNPVKVDEAERLLKVMNERMTQTAGYDPLMEIVPEIALNSETKELIDVVREISGRKLVFYSADKRLGTGGFVMSGNSNYLFVNIRLPKKLGLLRVVGHELFHVASRERVGGEFAKAAMSALGITNRAQLFEYFHTTSGLDAPYYDKKMTDWGFTVDQRYQYMAEEVAATRAGEVFADPKFWETLDNYLRVKNRTFIQRVYAWLKRVLDRVPVAQGEITEMIDAMERTRMAKDIRENTLPFDLEPDTFFATAENTRGLPLPDHYYQISPDGIYHGSSIGNVQAGLDSNAELIGEDRSFEAKKADAVDFITKSFGRGSVEDLSPKEHGELRRKIQQLSSREEISSTLSKLQITSFYNKMKSDEYRVFSHASFVKDLIEDIRLGKYSPSPQNPQAGLPLDADGNPIYNSIAEVYEHWAELQEYMKSAKYNDGVAVRNIADTKIGKAMKERQAMLQGFRDRLGAAGSRVGYDPTMFFTHTEYMAHIVRQYNSLSKADKLKVQGTRFAKYMKREGSESGYVSDVALADYLVLSRMMQDIMKFDALYEIKRYDIKKKLKGQPPPDGYSAVNASIMGLGMPQDAVWASQAYAAQAIVQQLGLPPSVAQIFIDRAKANEMVLPNNIVRALQKLTPNMTENRVAKAIAWGNHVYKTLLIRLPTRIMGYSLRNITGDLDALIATYPAVLNPKNKYITRAAGELGRFYAGGGDATANLMNYIWQGGLTTGMTRVELQDFRKVQNFDFYKDGKGTTKEQLVSLFKTVGTGYKNANEFREQLLRYATYLYMVENGLNNKYSLPATYGASIPAEIQAINSIEGRAYKLSNDALGAYNDVSSFTAEMAKYIPFIRWTEVNVKRYYRILKNIFYNDPAVVAGVGNHVAEKLGIAGKATAFTLFKLGRTAILMSLMTAAINIFNNVAFPDEEDKLPQYVKDELHFNFGMWGGKMYYFSGIGALADALDMFALDTPMQDFQDITRGRLTVGEKLLEIATSVPKSFISDLVPVAAGLQSILSGKKLFPEGATVRDGFETFFTTFGFGNEYKLLTKKPDRGVLDYARTVASGIRMAPVLEQEYWNAMDLKYDYLRRIDVPTNTYGYNPLQRAAYYYKMAIRMNDDDAALHYLTQYMALGGKKTDLNKTITSMDVYSQLTKQQKRDFIATLNDKEKAVFEKAEEFIDWMADETKDFTGEYWELAKEKEEG